MNASWKTFQEKAYDFLVSRCKPVNGNVQISLRCYGAHWQCLAGGGMLDRGVVESGSDGEPAAGPLLRLLSSVVLDVMRTTTKFTSAAEKQDSK